MFMMNHLVGFGAGDPDAVPVFRDNDFQESVTATYTFTSKAIGPASSDRYVIVGIAARSGNTSTSISSVTIGGVTATAVVTSIRAGDASGENAASFYIALVPTGTTGNVVVTFNTTYVRCDIVVWSATGLNSPTATATGSSSAAAPTASLNVMGGGFALGVAYSQNATSATWTNLTEVVDTSPGATNTYSGASSAFVAAQSSLAMTCTWASNLAPVGVFAAFR